MAVSALKTWIVEVLKAADLNAEFLNIYNNGEDLGWPATKAKDLDGQRFILDADADTYIEAVTDDEIDFYAAGVKVFEISKNAPQMASPLVTNGGFTIWQDGNITAASNNEMCADCWYYQDGGGSAVVDIAKIDPDSDSFGPGLKVDVTTADASLLGSVKYLMRHPIEGHLVKQLNIGTSSAREITLTFRVKATKTGTYCVAFRNDAANRSYIAEYTVSTADTDEEKSITLTLDTSGTWIRDSGDVGLELVFCFGAGTDHHGTANQWNADNNIATANQVNATDSVSNFFRITDVRIGIGGARIAMPARSLTDELKQCQRYRWVINEGEAQSAIALGYATGTSSARFYFTFPVTMMAKPTSVVVTFGSIQIEEADATNTAATSHTATFSSAQGARLTIAPTGSPLTAFQPVALEGGGGAGKIKFETPL